jgi:hypothetical protein
MYAPNTISLEKLVRLIGTPKCPTLIDLRAQVLFLTVAIRPSDSKQSVFHIDGIDRGIDHDFSCITCNFLLSKCKRAHH